MTDLNDSLMIRPYSPSAMLSVYRAQHPEIFFDLLKYLIWKCIASENSLSCYKKE